MEWYRFVIIGKVQGVFYRKSVSQSMMKNQFRGYIRNLEDGSVEVVAEIYDEDFDIFMKILQEGSPLSNVEEIRHEVIDDAEFHTDGFEIRN